MTPTKACYLASWSPSCHTLPSTMVENSPTESQLPITGRFREAWVGPVQSRCAHSPYDVGINTAWAVHTLLTTQTTLLGIMKQVLEWGGDTDSIGAIAWGIASCRMREELPAFFETDLEKENGSAYGPAYLKTLGKQLMD